MYNTNLVIETVFYIKNVNIINDFFVAKSESMSYCYNLQLIIYIWFLLPWLPLVYCVVWYIYHVRYITFIVACNHDIIKIRRLIFLKLYTSVYCQPLWGHIRVDILNRSIRDEPTKSLDIITVKTPRGVVWLVSI